MTNDTMADSFADSIELVCNACRVPIIGEQQRGEHYRSEWHRYNVKRKCASLPPLSEDDFAVKVTAVEQAENAAKPISHFSCGSCRKTFHSSTSHDDHLRSKKHKQRVASASPGAGVSALDNVSIASSQFVVVDSPSASPEAGAEPRPIPLGSCLFCPSKFGGADQCVDHMTKQHGFFIPYPEYLIDFQGMLVFFGCKVGIGHVCVYCNATFGSLGAVCSHMTDKSHCKMRWEPTDSAATEENPEIEIELNDGFEFDEFYDFEKDMVDDDGSMVIVAGPNATRNAIVDLNDAGEIICATGSIIGHREYRRFYRQSSRRTAVSLMAKKTLSSLKLIGSGVNSQVSAAQIKTGQRIERLRARQAYNYQFRSHKLAEFFKQQIPM